jgi:hypothetical protein
MLWFGGTPDLWFTRLWQPADGAPPVSPTRGRRPPATPKHYYTFPTRRTCWTPATAQGGVHAPGSLVCVCACTAGTKSVEGFRGSHFQKGINKPVPLRSSLQK